MAALYIYAPTMPGMMALIVVVAVEADAPSLQRRDVSVSLAGRDTQVALARRDAQIALA